jgi:hypothetical protein
MLNYIIRETDGRKYIEAIDEAFVLENEQDALDIAAVCGENGTSSLLLHNRNLPHGFFDLKTGLAGAVLQKFIMYRIKVAVVIPSRKIKGRFREMVTEANRGNHFRVFEKTEDAVKWLL